MLFYRIIYFMAISWKFLEKQTEEQILDFYHASGYLGALAEALHPNTVSKTKRMVG